MAETEKKTKGFLERIQTVRVELIKKGLKKSGKNKYSNFDYFELGDFTPEADKLFLENKIFPWFSLSIESEMIRKQEQPTGSEQLFNYEFNQVEYAVLTLHDMESKETLVSKCRTVEADVKGTSAIQAAGAKHTYYRRYLYIDALNLAESDAVDASDNTENKEDNPVKKTSVKSVKEEPKKEVAETQTVIEANSQLLTPETRSEIMTYIKSKNGSLSMLDAINKVAENMGTDKTWFKEDDKDQIISVIDSLDSLGEL